MMLDRVIYRWRLGNGVERNREFPQSFSIPSEVDKAFLWPGDHVKVMFEFRRQPRRGPGGERMWLEVVSRKGDRFVGMAPQRSGLHSPARIRRSREVPRRAHHRLRIRGGHGARTAGWLGHRLRLNCETTPRPE
jgi:hypothetical protein